MAYKQMPIVEVDVANLRLDLDNYRIPIKPDDEAAALNYLFASEDVIGQAKLFLRDGYFDNEVPIAVKHGKTFVVLEGNRRVSALKVIADPELVPEHEAEVRQLLTRFNTETANIPSTIRVLVVPNRDAAARHIARLHTGVSKKRWNKDQQANYYYSLLGPTTHVDDVKARYPGVNVVRFLRMVAMRQFLSGVKFKDKSLTEYVKGPDLTMSAFEYAYRPADLAAAMGVEFEVDRIKPTRLEPARIGARLTPQQREAVEHLMTGFRAERYNTRSPAFRKDSDERKALLGMLLGRSRGPATGDRVGDDPDGDEPIDDDEVTEEGGGDTGTGDQGGGADPTGDAPSGGGIPRGPNHPDTKRGFTISGLSFAHAPSNLQKRYQELRKINVSETPAAAAMLLRSVLESTIKFHFSGTPNAVSGELGNVLPTVDTEYGKMRSLKATIGTVRHGLVTTPGSLNWFNAAAHNPDFPIKGSDARDAFSLVETLLRHLLIPPATPTG